MWGTFKRSRCGSDTRNEQRGLTRPLHTSPLLTDSMAAYAKTEGRGLKKQSLYRNSELPRSFALARRSRCKSGFGVKKNLFPLRRGNDGGGFGAPHAPHFTQYFTTWIGNPLLSPRDAATGARRELSLARNERDATRGGGRKKRKRGHSLGWRLPRRTERAASPRPFRARRKTSRDEGEGARRFVSQPGRAGACPAARDRGSPGRCFASLPICFSRRGGNPRGYRKDCLF